MTLKTKNKSQVLRMCIVSHKKFPKDKLIRIIKNKKNEYYIDHTYDSKPGRSAYIQKDYSLWQKIINKKILHKAFRSQVPEYAYQLIEKELSKYEKK